MKKLEQLNIEIAGGCNLKCRMCPQEKGRGTDFLKLMPFAVFEKVVLDAIDHGVISVSLHGSGEPTLHPDLVRMVKFLSDKGLYSSFFTNAVRLTTALYEELGKAGLDLITVSIVGHTKEAHEHWMNGKYSDTVFANLKGCFEAKARLGLKTDIHTRHLVIDASKSDEEVDGYRKNWIEPLGCMAEIWLMHNWSGGLPPEKYDRKDLSVSVKRSCGRPFSPTLEVRAGGKNGHHASVVPCPFVLGRDSDAIMGYLDSNTIEEVYSSDVFKEVCRLHEEQKFDEIDFCKDCDQLYTVPMALVWTNIPGRFYGQSKTSTVIYPEFGPSKIK